MERWLSQRRLDRRESRAVMNHASSFWTRRLAAENIFFEKIKCGVVTLRPSSNKSWGMLYNYPNEQELSLLAEHSFCKGTSSHQFKFVNGFESTQKTCTVHTVYLNLKTRAQFGAILIISVCTKITTLVHMTLRPTSWANYLHIMIFERCFFWLWNSH